MNGWREQGFFQFNKPFCKNYPVHAQGFPGARPQEQGRRIRGHSSQLTEARTSGRRREGPPGFLHHLVEISRSLRHSKNKLAATPGQQTG